MGVPAAITTYLRYLRDQHRLAETAWYRFGPVLERERRERFETVVRLLEPEVAAVLGDVDRYLLGGRGELRRSQVMTDGHGTSFVSWQLSWPAQRTHGMPPLSVIALCRNDASGIEVRGSTVASWPLCVDTAPQAREAATVLRALAIAELHNLNVMSTGDLFGEVAS